jgi:hypothetical protein
MLQTYIYRKLCKSLRTHCSTHRKCEVKIYFMYSHCPYIKEVKVFLCKPDVALGVPGG